MDHIHVHGRVNDQELWHHLHEADVLVRAFPWAVRASG